jgi:hypothetical protein
MLKKTFCTGDDLFLELPELVQNPFPGLVNLHYEGRLTAGPAFLLWAGQPFIYSWMTAGTVYITRAGQPSVRG